MQPPCLPPAASARELAARSCAAPPEPRADRASAVPPSLPTTDQDPWCAAAESMLHDQSLVLSGLIDLLHSAGEDIEAVAAPCQQIGEVSCLVDSIARRRLIEGELLSRQTHAAPDLAGHAALVQDACAVQRVLHEYAKQLAGPSAGRLAR